MHLDLEQALTRAPARTGRYDRIILHIGTHKTGSTAIQNALKSFDDGSAIYAPFEHVNHSVPLYTIFARNYLRYHVWTDRGLDAPQIEALRARQFDLLSATLQRQDRQTLIISGEDISLIEPEGVAQLIRMLRPHARSVQAICYVRSPVSFAASAFQQRCQGGLSQLPERIDPQYRSRIEKFITQLGAENLTIRRFDRATLKNGDVAQDFAAFCGITCADPGGNSRNASLSSAALKRLFQFNRTGLLKSGDAVLSKARQQLIWQLRQAYADAAPIDSGRFHALAVFDDVDWLRDCCGIDFSASRADAGMSRDALEAWLSDWSGVDDAPLRQMLSDYGLNGRYGDAGDQVCRLFYHLIHLSQNQADAARHGLLRSAVAFLRRVKAISASTTGPRG